MRRKTHLQDAVGLSMSDRYRLFVVEVINITLLRLSKGFCLVVIGKSRTVESCCTYSQLDTMEESRMRRIDRARHRISGTLVAATLSLAACRQPSPQKVTPEYVVE